MHGLTVPACALALALIIGAYLAGGRYEMSDQQAGSVFIVDRFTGSVRWCDLGTCEAVKEKP